MQFNFASFSTGTGSRKVWARSLILDENIKQSASYLGLRCNCIPDTRPKLSRNSSPIIIWRFLSGLCWKRNGLRYWKTHARMWLWTTRKHITKTIFYWLLKWAWLIMKASILSTLAEKLSKNSSFQSLVLEILSKLIELWTQKSTTRFWSHIQYHLGKASNWQ